MAHSTAYPKILHLGSPGIQSIFEEPVEITEKLDGSQFGFGKIDGKLIIRSKGQELTEGNIQKLFEPAYNYVKTLEDKIPDNTFFYGETLAKPRHSTLAYERVPKNNIALFGVLHVSTLSGDGGTLGNYAEIKQYAELFDVDPIPLLYEGMADVEKIKSFFDPENPVVSYLGGQPIEGVVVKNYKPWLFLNQILMPVMGGKFVTEAFKEVHNKDWSKLNTSKGKFGDIQDKYRSEARWQKAVMRMKENGTFTGTVKDIGELIKLTKLDLLEEETDNIKQDLWRCFADDIVRHATYGLPQWYKDRLLEGENNAPEDT